MLRLKAGDSAAMQPLLERNHARILNLAWRFSGDRNQAEEVAQETVLRVYQARERYRPDRPFRAYVTRIATNLCISGVRSRVRRRTYNTLGDPHGGDQPINGLLRREMRERVREAIDSLPQRQRMAIVLQRFEDRSYEEVADVLGLTVSATKSLLHRARASLRALLMDYSACSA